MKDIKKARKELIRVGCTKAKGDALRFMYANLLAFEQGLSVKPNNVDWPVPDLYAELGQVVDTQIYARVQEIRGGHKRRCGI